MNRFFWNGIYNGERNEGIVRMEECINKYGFIIDFKFFSDLSISMVIETDEERLQALYEDLRKIVHISHSQESGSAPKTACVILLSVIFSRGTGRMSVEIPIVPG